MVSLQHSIRWVEPVISKDATVREAITVCIERKLSGMMVVDRSDSINREAHSTMELKQKCVGLITSRDLLRMLAASIKEGKSADDMLNERISNQMTAIDQVIYGRPDETIGTSNISVTAAAGKMNLCLHTLPQYITKLG